uniref:Uncharacterized protein n=1 Tax=Acrobeloides nanus TaxID=290746 RepID=A0A914DLB5_9BILA
MKYIGEDMRRRDLSVLESEKHARARSEDGRRSPMKEEEGGEERMALHFMKLSRSRLSSICACLMMSCAVIRSLDIFFVGYCSSSPSCWNCPVFFRVVTTGRKSDKELNDGI